MFFTGMIMIYSKAKKLKCVRPLSQKGVTLNPFPITLDSVSCKCGRISFGRTHVVLLDLVKQSPIANLEQPRCGLSIPASFLKSRCDCISFSFAPDTLHQGLE